ncbi:MAG TPA: 3-carboxy-cis,cis-muconate cycloisomerase, partial [Achromobacter sp.]|nr:3-carboxy-cis,cis-muconate cycloisomerase [Achromobacter sp.]
MSNLSGLTETVYSDDAILSLFSGPATIGQMLAVEAALARAQAQCGVIPPSAAKAIDEVCRGGQVLDMLDMDAIATAAVAAGNVVIPFVKQLTAAVARVDAEAARYVHWGATSQDIQDTALVLQLLQVVIRLDAGLESATLACARLTGAHRDTIMVGRTWLQHALPTTFGAKTAGWLEALERSRLRLRQDASQLAL